MKEQDFVANGIVQIPQAVLPASLEPTLLMLHAALSIEELWQAVVKGLRAALEIQNVAMALFPWEKGAAALRVSNPVPDLKLYAAKIDAMSLVHAVLARHPEACVLRISDDVPEGSLIETPFYKNLMGPQGSRFAAAMVLRESARMLGWMWINRRASQGDFTAREMTLLNTLYVQFSVAAQRVCRFESELRANKVQAQNGGHDPATLLLDERGAPLFHNRAAVRICALWRLGPEQARILKPEFRLPTEIRCACDDLSKAWQKCRRKGRVAETEVTRNIAHAGGLSANVQLFRMGAKVHFLVHLSLRGPNEPDLSVLALLRRLTVTEQTVAKLVAWGFDNQEIAKELWISVNTVRAHLHNIFHKLEVNCRGKLAAILRPFCSHAG